MNEKLKTMCLSIGGIQLKIQYKDLDMYTGEEKGLLRAIEATQRVTNVAGIWQLLATLVES